MKLTAWVAVGSLVANLLLALLVAGACGALPVRAGEPTPREVPHADRHPHPQAVLRAPLARRHHSYLVEARMGWAIG